MSEVEIDLVDGDDPSNFECPDCGCPYKSTKWESIHGCARCGIGRNACPRDGCDGEAVIYF